MSYRCAIHGWASEQVPCPDCTAVPRVSLPPLTIEEVGALKWWARPQAQVYSAIEISAVPSGSSIVADERAVTDSSQDTCEQSVTGENVKKFVIQTEDPRDSITITAEAHDDGKLVVMLSQPNDGEPGHRVVLTGRQIEIALKQIVMTVASCRGVVTSCLPSEFPRFYTIVREP